MCSFSSFVLASTPLSTFCVCSPRPHHDDAFDRIIRLVEAELAQPRRVPDLYLRRCRRCASARHSASPPQYWQCPHVSRTRPTPRDVIELLPLLVKSAARIRVVHRELLNHGRHGDVIGVEPGRIEQHLVLHHGAAKAGVVRHAGHLLILPLHHPVFNRLQFLRRAVGAFNHVAINQPRWASQRRQRRRHALRDKSLRSAAETPLRAQSNRPCLRRRS